MAKLSDVRRHYQKPLFHPGGWYMDGVMMPAIPCPQIAAQSANIGLARRGALGQGQRNGRWVLIEVRPGFPRRAADPYPSLRKARSKAAAAGSSAGLAASQDREWRCPLPPLCAGRAKQRCPADYRGRILQDSAQTAILDAVPKAAIRGRPRPAAWSARVVRGLRQRRAGRLSANAALSLLASVRGM